MRIFYIYFLCFVGNIFQCQMGLTIKVEPDSICFIAPMLCCRHSFVGNEKGRVLMPPSDEMLELLRRLEDDEEE